ncbi:MAG: hypothetical protein M1833_005697 [Piccolia ochrophora]|nr:MAG: hypothetical protein M1833_005697 [Piccolia ochrophora]
MADENPSHEPKSDIYTQASADGHFKRQTASFRSHITSSSTEFPPEPHRYVLYINYGCPWAHRANLVLHLKGLTPFIQLVVMDYEIGPEGWFYSGRLGTAPRDPVYGFTLHRQLYHKADPSYDKRYTVPVLWDKKYETIVSNESSEIIRMLYSAFDHLLPEERREASRPLYPAHLRGKIDEMNTWVYDTINNGVYKTGFAATQEAYDANVYPLFQSLDRLEEHLGQEGHQPYLFGDHITEADIRLYTTLVRFDVAYHGMFNCNLKMIRHDYPRLHAWLRRLYWDDSDETNAGAFRNTTHFEHIKRGYCKVQKIPVLPAGPDPNILPIDAK